MTVNSGSARYEGFGKDGKGHIWTARGALDAQPYGFASRFEDGPGLLAAAEQHGLEGVIAKRLDCPYLPGRRSPSWIKVRNICSTDVVIGGWLPGEGGRSGGIGSLLLGVYESLHEAEQAVAELPLYLGFASNPRGREMRELYDQRMALLVSSGKLKPIFERWQEPYPFEGSANDVPITSISRNIEIDLMERQSLFSKSNHLFK